MARLTQNNAPKWDFCLTRAQGAPATRRCKQRHKPNGKLAHSLNITPCHWATGFWRMDVTQVSFLSHFFVIPPRYLGRH